MAALHSQLGTRWEGRKAMAFRLEQRSTLALPEGGFGGVGFLFEAAALAALGPGPLCPGGALYPGGRSVFFLRRTICTGSLTVLI